MNDLKHNIAAEARRIEEDTEHSTKAHYNAADRWGRYHLYLGLPAAVIGAVASAAAFKDFPELAGGLALVATALTTVLTFLKPSERAEMHKAAAGQYHALRNQTRIFRSIEVADAIEAGTAKARLLELAKMRDELNATAPGIPRSDYEMARVDIDNGRSRYQVDGETK